MYTLDTNAIIYYFKNDPQAVSVIERIFSENTPIYLSTISEIELFGFSNLTAQEIEQFEQFLYTVSVIPVDSRIARIAGTLRREYHLKTPDSAIAATSLFTGYTLVTRNLKDFQKVPNLIVTPL
jgi:predicted nucleic acid-binding protein